MRFSVLTMLLLSAGPVPALAEVIAFQSYAPASERPLLTRTYPRDHPVTVTGTLSLPAQKSPYQRAGRVPAVILMHGSGGIMRDREPAWAQRLNDRGIAAFYVDSFTGRGVIAPNYAGSPNFIPTVAHVVDAYQALAVLSRHLGIDANRVAITGFSRGGEVALTSMFDRFRRGSLDDPSLRFAGHIAFYPYCAVHYRGKEVTSAPLLMLLGGADDMANPETCRRQADWLGTRTAVRTVQFPGANHDFDRSTNVSFDAQAVGIRACEADYDVDTMVVRYWREGVSLGAADWLAQCRYHGAHVGGNPAALRGSIEEVGRFLAQVFR
jgi:dienelactone hydrolase